MRAAQSPRAQVQSHGRHRVFSGIVRGALGLDDLAEDFGGERSKLERFSGVPLEDGVSRGVAAAVRGVVDAEALEVVREVVADEEGSSVVEDGEDARANVVDGGRAREGLGRDARERGAMVGDGGGGGDVGGEEGGAGVVDDAHARAHRAAAVGLRADHLAVERHRGARAGRLGTGSDFKRASAGGVRGRRALRRDGEATRAPGEVIPRLAPLVRELPVDVLAKGVQVGEVLAAGAASRVVRGVSRLRAMRDELLGRLEPLVAVPARRLRRPRRVRRRRGRLRVLVLAARAEVEGADTAPSAEGRNARHGECAAGRSRLNRETAGRASEKARASLVFATTRFLTVRGSGAAASEGTGPRPGGDPPDTTALAVVMRTMPRFLSHPAALVLIMVGAFVALGLLLRGLGEAGAIPKADRRRLLDASRLRHLSSANPASRAPRRALLASPLRVYPFFGFLPPNPEEFSAWSSWQPRTWAFNVNDQAVGSLTARRAGYTGLGLSAEASVDVARGEENEPETQRTDA